MKTVIAPKKESNILVILAPKIRVRGIPQRNAVHKNRKAYNRREGKAIY